MYRDCIRVDLDQVERRFIRETLRRYVIRFLKHLRAETYVLQKCIRHSRAAYERIFAASKSRCWTETVIILKRDGVLTENL